jgi:curved DNA-binding protein
VDDASTPSGDSAALLTLGFAEALAGARRAVETPFGEREVEIRPGAIDGQLIRARVTGAALPGLDRDDDVWVRVHVTPDPRFRREGRDVHTDVPISLGEAAWGAEIDVETPWGPRRARVPPGVESGQHLRIRHLGVAASDGVPPGHLYVNLRVQLPDIDPDDEEARAAIRVLEARYRSRPRA